MELEIIEKYLDNWVITKFNSYPICLRFLDRRLYEKYSEVMPHIFEWK